MQYAAFSPADAKSTLIIVPGVPEQESGKRAQVARSEMVREEPLRFLFCFLFPELLDSTGGEPDGAGEETRAKSAESMAEPVRACFTGPTGSTVALGRLAAAEVPVLLREDIIPRPPLEEN